MYHVYLSCLRHALPSSQHVSFTHCKKIGLLTANIVNVCVSTNSIETKTNQHIIVDFIKANPRLYIWYIYLHLLDVYGKNVGKYTVRPMDPPWFPALAGLGISGKLRSKCFSSLEIAGQITLGFSECVAKDLGSWYFNYLSTTRTSVFEEIFGWSFLLLVL